MLQESCELKGDRNEGAQCSCGQSRHAEQEDEGRNSIFAGGHPEKPRDDAEPETQEETKADMERIDGDSPTGPDLEQDESESGGHENPREKDLESRRGDPLRDHGTHKHARQARRHKEKGQDQEIEVEVPCLAEDDVESRHAEANQKIRGDHPAHATEEGQETGTRYSPPPTPVKPESTPIGKAKRLPIASPSRFSARIPEGRSINPPKDVYPIYFPRTRLDRVASPFSMPGKPPIPRDRGVCPQLVRACHGVRSRRTDRMRPRSTEIEPR